MSESFHHVLFPGTCNVLGRDLPALSLWSLSVLQALGSPFLSLSADTEFTLGDLQVAVRCACASTLQPPQLKPRWRDRWQHRRHVRDLSHLKKHGAAFIAWLRAHQQIPALWQQETQGDVRLISAPMALSQVTALMALGMTHHEAWSCSPGYASWIILAHRERSSDEIRFAEDDEEQDFEAELEAEELRSEAEIIAQAKAELPPAFFERWLSARNANLEVPS
jgi:hypothetical protein